MAKPRTPELAVEQVEVVAQFSYRSLSHFISRSVDEVVRKVVPERSATGRAAKQFQQKAKETLDRKREY